jgi:hypothetical protein
MYSFILSLAAGGQIAHSRIVAWDRPKRHPDLMYVRGHWLQASPMLDPCTSCALFPTDSIDQAGSSQSVPIGGESGQ